MTSWCTSLFGRNTPPLTHAPHKFTNRRQQKTGHASRTSPSIGRPTRPGRNYEIICNIRNCAGGAITLVGLRGARRFAGGRLCPAAKFVQGRERRAKLFSVHAGSTRVNRDWDDLDLQAGCMSGKPWLSQGVCFGIAWAVAVCIPTYLIYFSVQPMPSALVSKQIIFDCVATVIMGIACAYLNRNTERAGFA